MCVIGLRQWRDALHRGGTDLRTETDLIGATT
jgi:hypothetical protein